MFYKKTKESVKYLMQLYIRECLMGMLSNEMVAPAGMGDTGDRKSSSTLRAHGYFKF